MSDELSNGVNGVNRVNGVNGFTDDTDGTDELSVALREFAAEAEQGARPVLTGAQVRGRAVRRARRRTAGLLAAGAVALALVGFALTQDLTGKDNSRQLPGTAAPAAPAPSRSAPPSPSAAVSTPASAVPATGTLDLAKRALLIEGRVMPLTSDSANSPTFVGPLTVYRKHETKVLTVTDPTAGVGLYTQVTLAVELRDADNKPVYVGVTRSYKGKSPAMQGTDVTDATGAWISLDGADAKWFYQDVKIGSVLSITGGSA